jgi:hypothetical protein
MQPLRPDQCDGDQEEQKARALGRENSACELWTLQSADGSRNAVRLLVADPNS